MEVALIPPEPWEPERRAFMPGTAPDPYKIYRVLADEGINVTLIDPGSLPWNPFGGMVSYFRGIDPLRSLNILLSRKKIDLVVSVFETSVLPLLLLRRAVFSRVPITVWDVALTETWKLGRLVHDMVLPNIDDIFLLSSFQKAYIEKHWNIRCTPQVVGQHVDTDFFVPNYDTFGGPLLSIGDDIGRDFDTLIAAVAGLKISTIIKTRLPLNLPAEAFNVRTIPQRLSFIELRTLYASCCFVVIPLKYTLNVSGVGSILETMAMGKALIVSDNPVIRDFIIPNETCLVVPIGDVEAMRSAVNLLDTNPEMARRLGEAGRAFVESRFAKAVFAQRLGAAFKTTMERMVAAPG
jgi:glycosyltransferase involved in cell wall biosynthesis